MKNKQKRNVAINIILVILIQIALNVLIPIKSIAADEIITIQCDDVNFYNELISNLKDKIQSKDGTNKTIIMTKSNVESVTGIGIESSNMNSIKGIEKFTNLTRLNIGGTKIRDISAIGELTNLTSLKLEYNLIKDISALGNLKKLTTLDLRLNQITDISVISGLTNLKSLDLNSNEISDISVLSELTNLTSLDLYSNKISDISVISELTNLRSLELGNNQINDISALSGLTNLTSLNLKSNEISNINVIGGLTNLTSLDLGSNKISNINIIGSLTNLESLDLGINQISDISVLENLTRLTYLDLGYNQISDISVISGMTKLTTLKLQNQTIEKTVGKEGTQEVELPQIIKAAKDSTSKVYTEEDYILSNCTLSSDGTKVIVDTDKVEKASIKVNGGQAGGTVLNIIVTGEDTIPPTVEVKNSITTPTNQNVTVTITANEEIQEVEGWTLSEGKTILTKEYTENGEETVEVKDLAGNTTTANVKIDNIDKVAPEVEVKYSATTSTNENITVTITANEEIQAVEGWTLGSDKKTLTKIYTENKTETIAIKDLAGNITTAEVIVNNIEEKKLKATVKYSTVKPTNQNVIVTITSDKEMQEVEGWMLDASKKVMTKEYAENKEEEITITDLEGNTTKANINITNIDKEKPEIKMSYSNTEQTNGKVKVTIEVNKDIQVPKGWILDEQNNIIYKEYDANTEETVTIVDLAGNETEVQIKIDNIIGNKTNNNGDDTISNIDIPKAGIKTRILMSILFLIVCGIVTYKKYGKYKDIK